ncbi:MAG TPA: hypothetical protein VFB68_06805, partial [Xanthobacteraceae bacterium]|nr:hypothetical protein [Xanthobacteraceae bacterium]
NHPSVLGQPAESADEAARNAMLLEVSLRRSGLGLIEALRLARLPEHEQIVVVVDQFEELFRFANASGKPRQEDDAAAFVKLLLEAKEQSELPLYIVLTSNWSGLSPTSLSSRLTRRAARSIHRRRGPARRWRRGAARGSCAG